MVPEFLSCAIPFTLLLEILSLVILICNLRTNKKCSESSSPAVRTPGRPTETVVDPSTVLHCYDDVILDAFNPEPKISPTEDKKNADCSSSTPGKPRRRRLVPPMVLHVYDDAILDAFYPTYVDEPVIPDNLTIPHTNSLEVDGLQRDESPDSPLSIIPASSVPVVVKSNPFLSLLISLPYFINHSAGMSPALRTARRFTVHSFHSFMREIIFSSAYRSLSQSLPRLTASPSQGIVLPPRGQEMFSSQMIFHGKPPSKTTPMQWVKAAEMTFLIVTLQNCTSHQLRPTAGSLVSQAAHIEDIKRTASFVLMSANNEQDETIVPLLRCAITRRRRNWLSSYNHQCTIKPPTTISALALQAKLLVVLAKLQLTDQQVLPLKTSDKKLQNRGIEYEEITDDDDESTICNTISTLTPDTEEFFNDETTKVNKNETNDKQQETSSRLQIEELEKMVTALTQQLTTYREEMTSLLHKKDCELNEVKQKLSEYVKLIGRINANKDMKFNTHHCQPLQQQLATSLKKNEEELERTKAYLDKLLERVIEQAPHVLENMTA